MIAVITNCNCLPAIDSRRSVQCRSNKSVVEDLIIIVAFVVCAEYIYNLHNSRDYTQLHLASLTRDAPTVYQLFDARHGMSEGQDSFLRLFHRATR